MKEKHGSLKKREREKYEKRKMRKKEKDSMLSTQTRDSNQAPKRDISSHHTCTWPKSHLIVIPFLDT